jgi:hypothetical protein
MFIWHGDALLTYVLGRTLHDIGGGNFESETHVGQAGGDHDNPHDLNGSQREHGKTAAVLEGKTDKQDTGLGDVLSEHVEDELLDVVEHAATLLDGVEDRSKVIVGEHDIRSLLGDIGTGLTHGNTNVGTLERGRVVDTVTGHGDEALATVKSLNHADLGLGSATGDNERKAGKLINLLIGELVEIVSGHNHSLGDIGSDLVHAGRQDADLEGDGTGGLRVVTSQHVDADTSLVEHGDGRTRLGAGRVVEADKTAEGEVVLVEGAVKVLVTIDRADVLLGGEGKNTETKAGKRLHVVEDLALGLLGELDNLVADLDLGARGDDTLDGTLGEEPVLVLLGVGEDDGHLLDVRVEGELGNLVPAVALARKPETVPVEARGKDLDGYLGGVTTSVPLALFVLVDGGQVGKRGDVHVGLESLAAVDLLAGVLHDVALCTLSLESDVPGLVGAGGEGTLGGVEGLGGVLDGEGADTGDPGLADNHVTLSQSTGLVGANVYMMVRSGWFSRDWGRTY